MKSVVEWAWGRWCTDGVVAQQLFLQRTWFVSSTCMMAHKFLHLQFQVMCLSVLLIATKRYHDHGHDQSKLQRKAFTWGLAYCFEG